MPNKKKRSDWFTNATLRAAMADRPEIMQASGWTYDKDNNLYQGDPNEAGATALRNALAEIGITVTLGTAFDLVGAGITSVPAVQRYLANREISGVIKNASKGVSTDSAVRGGDVSFQVDASPNFSVSSSDYSITRTPSYSGRVVTSQNPAYRTFAEDVEQGARWGYNRGTPLTPEYNEYNLVGAKELSNGAEARVYVDPNDNGYVLKQLSGADPVRFKMPYSGFETPEEAVSFGHDYVSVKNSKPYNIVHNVAGYAENGVGKYEPVLRQKMVSVPGGENWLKQKPDIVRFARKIGSPEFPESGMYDVSVNNILLENDLPINDRIDFKPKNLGVLPDGTVMGIDLFKNGGSIHIKPSKKGTFTAAATKHGKSVQAFASQVLAHPENYSSAMVRKANFARNASKWHEDGGFLQQYPDGGKMYETGSPSSGMNPVTNLFHAARNKYLTHYANKGNMYSYPFTAKSLLEDYILSPYNYKRRYRTGVTERDQKLLDDYLNGGAQRRALFAKYYNLEDTDYKPEDYITESRYRPSKSTNPDAKYYTYKTDDAYDRSTSFLANNGTVIIDEGNDENGNYMSIYDIWDLAPFGSRVGNQMGGTPIEMYDRFYESESPKIYYRLKEMSNKDEYASGGRIKGKRNGKFYVTELNDRREKKFQDWYANAAATLGLDPNPDAYEHAYDYRGYWLNNRDADVSSPDFHFPDTWKQPHHPTFSDESIYAKGHEGVGHWEGETFVPGPFNNIMQATEPSATISEEAPITYGSNYTPSDNILQYIKDIEAFRDQWYQDGNGVWTVGYGFTGDDVRRRYPNGMTRAEADQYFADTVSRRIPMFVKATPNFDKLNQNQRDALFSYYYNIGHGGYTDKSPNMQAGLRNMDLDTVVNNIDFGYNDKKNRGLRKRRDYERKLFGTPMDYGGILNRLRNVYGDNESVKAAILRAKNVKK